MTVNVYFSNEILASTGVKVDNKTGKFQVSGLPLSQMNGRVWVGFGDNAFIPEEILEFVEEVSLYENFSTPARSERETGIYQYKSAEGDLATEFCHDEERYRIRIKGKNLDDVRDLCRLIKTGAIRPVESYEGKQQGQSRAELEKELESLRRQADDLKRVVEDIITFRYTLAGKWWPLCSKWAVVKGLDVTMDAPVD